MDRLVLSVPLVQLDLLVKTEISDHLAALVQRVRREHLVHRATLDRLELQEHLERKVLQDQLDRRATPVSREIPVFLAQMESLDHLVQVDLPDYQDL